MTHHNSLYPWDDWFARKKPFVLKKGIDYKCQPHSMAQQVRNAALTRGVQVSIQIQGKILVVTSWSV